MADMLLTEYGMDIRHTHNDLLDMLTVAGVFGAAWLLLLIGTLLRQVIRSSIMSSEGAAGMAILLTYVLHGQLTGQLWGTDAMAYYTVALACLYSNAREGVELSPATVQEKDTAIHGCSRNKLDGRRTNDVRTKNGTCARTTCRNRYTPVGLGANS